MARGASCGKTQNGADAVPSYKLLRRKARATITQGRHIHVCCVTRLYFFPLGRPGLLVHLPSSTDRDEVAVRRDEAKCGAPWAAANSPSCVSRGASVRMRASPRSVGTRGARGG